MSTLDSYQEGMRRGGYSFRPTTDSWAGTFPDGTVGIAIVPLTKWVRGKCGRLTKDDSNVIWYRVCVWGTDDTGMEIDNLSHDEARRIVLSLPSIITMADLATRGFHRA